MAKNIVRVATAGGWMNPALNLNFTPDLQGAHQNALATHAGRLKAQDYPEDRNYLRQQRTNALADRQMKIEDRNYGISQRPAVELERESNIFRGLLPGMDLKRYSESLPMLRERLPTLGPTLDSVEQIEAEAREKGMDPEAYFQQEVQRVTGKTPEADKPAGWSAPREGIDESGNPIVYRVNKDTGKPQIIKGVGPTPKKGMVIRDPATGNIIFDSTGGQSDLTKKTIGKIEGKVIDGSEQLARMNNIYSEYKPEYQEVGTRFKAAWTGTKAFLGIGVEEKDRTLLTEFKGFQRKAIENINLYIKELTGAQMSEKEADRLRLAQPDPGEKWYNGDDPITFKAKMDDVLKTTRAAVARWKYYKSKQYTDDQIKALINKGDAMNLNDLANRMK